MVGRFTGVKVERNLKCNLQCNLQCNLHHLPVIHTRSTTHLGEVSSPLFHVKISTLSSLGQATLNCKVYSLLSSSSWEPMVRSYIPSVVKLGNPDRANANVSAGMAKGGNIPESRRSDWPQMLPIPLTTPRIFCT